jgi:elongation factor Ts
VSVKPEDVKKLRDKTGAGMLDCKNALIEAAGDFSKAEKLLKEQGLAAAAKRSGRATNEGRVFTMVKGDKAGVMELSCETDFVAINEVFVKSGTALLEGCIDAGTETLTSALEDQLKGAISTLKENIAARRIKILSIGANEMVVDYIHGAGKIGVLVKLAVEKPELLNDEQVKQLGFDLALHVAAFAPMYLSRNDVDPAYLKEQEEIFTKQSEGLDKPEKVLQGIIQGKLNKHLGSICLLDQGFVKEEKVSVGKILEGLSKEVGGKITIAEYVSFKLGEELV